MTPDNLACQSRFSHQDNSPQIPQATNIPMYIDDALGLTFSAMYGTPNEYIGVPPAPATTIPRTNSA